MYSLYTHLIDVLVLFYKYPIPNSHWLKCNFSPFWLNAQYDLDCLQSAVKPKSTNQPCYCSSGLEPDLQKK